MCYIDFCVFFQSLVYCVQPASEWGGVGVEGRRKGGDEGEGEEVGLAKDDLVIIARFQLSGCHDLGGGTFHPIAIYEPEG